MASRDGLIAFENREAMAARLADLLEHALARAISERGAARLAVSGGATPAGLYGDLSRRVIEWRRVTAALVDERWVPPGDKASNESFVRKTLMINEAAALTLVGLWSDAPTPVAGLAAAESRLSQFDDEFDVAVLGMGADGHTASWFPHADGLDMALSDERSKVAAVTAEPSAVTGAYCERITLTLGALRRARVVVLLLTGDEKRAAFERARQAGPVEAMPVRALLASRPDLWAAWAP